MPQWYINLEDKEEEHAPVIHTTVHPEDAQQCLVDLLQRCRANKPLRC